MNGKQFKSVFEQFFPLQLAYDWDQVGLQIGTLDKDITGILLSLDITLEVIDEALSVGANLIVVHHPILFRPLTVISPDTYLGMLIERLIKNDIAVYVAHTNFDVSNYGMNTILANMLQLEDQKIIEFTTETEGLGRYGHLSQPQSLESFVNTLKQTFHLDKVRLIGELDQEVFVVGIAGGSGSSLIPYIMEHGIDVLVTGDVSYHHALDAINMGITVIDIGHNIEKYALDSLRTFLIEQQVNVPIRVSKIDTNPYKFV